MECNISTKADQWSCTVSLRRYDHKMEEPFSPEIKDKNDVELWIRRAQAAVLCPHIPGDTFKSKAREDIRTLTDTESDPKVLSFTKSKVVININDPDGTDLSFVDLPGEYSSDVPIPPALTHYVYRQDSLRTTGRTSSNLWMTSPWSTLNHPRLLSWSLPRRTVSLSTIRTIGALPYACTDEMENQKAMRFAREKDPSGRRTICELLTDLWCN